MNLYLISQSVNNNWDTYDSAVVAAESVEEARVTYPGNSDYKWSGSQWMWHLSDGRVMKACPSSWTTPDNVLVEFLAENYDGPAGTVCASFNAG